MATVFKPTYSTAVPADAEIITKKGKRCAKFGILDRRTQKRRQVVAPLVDGNPSRCLVESSAWYARFTLDDGRVVKRPTGITDKGEAERSAADMERTARDEASGAVDPMAKHLTRPIMEHVEDYARNILDRGKTYIHFFATRSRVAKTVKACGFEVITDVSKEAVEAFLADLQRMGRSIGSANHYGNSMKTFCQWMLISERAARNPLAGWKKQNVELGRVRERRALTIEEQGRLI